MKALDATMQAVSDTVHEQRVSGYRTSSASRRQTCCETTSALSESLHTDGESASTNKDGVACVAPQGSGVRHEDTSAFLKELVSPILSELTLSEGTRSGLLIAEVKVRQLKSLSGHNSKWSKTLSFKKTCELSSGSNFRLNE